MRPLPEAESIWFLGLVENGIITLATAQDTDDTLVVYAASNGWTLCVFSDCGDWDYIEWISDNRGRFWEYPDLGEIAGPERDLMDYRPDDNVCKEAYGFKGYWCTR